MPLLKGKITRTESVEVPISLQDLFYELNRELRTRLGVAHDVRVEGGKLVCDERDHRHGSVGTDIIDPSPLPQVVAVVNALETLNSAVYDLEHIKRSKK